MKRLSKKRRAIWAMMKALGKIIKITVVILAFVGVLFAGWLAYTQTLIFSIIALVGLFLLLAWFEYQEIDR